MTEQTHIPTPTGAIIIQHGLLGLVAICRSWLATAFVVTVGIAYWHYGSEWHLINLGLFLLVFWTICGYAYGWLRTRYRKPLAITFCALFGLLVWNVLDITKWPLSPSYVLIGTFDVYPMRPLHKSIEVTTGFRINAYSRY